MWSMSHLYNRSLFVVRSDSTDRIREVGQVLESQQSKVIE
jgi:hypothetical protein